MYSLIHRLLTVLDLPTISMKLGHFYPQQSWNLKLIIGLILIGFLQQGCEPSFPPISENESELIRINQIGYYPNAPKRFMVTGGQFAKFYMLDDNEEVVFEGELTPSVYWEIAGEKTQEGDFSKFNQVGNYRLYVPDLGYSYPFEIGSNVLKPALEAAIRGFYYQRSGMTLEKVNAKEWERPLGHPDEEVIFHPSSGHTESSYSSPKGWYDAGDFNKYTVNGAFSVGQLLRLYLTFPKLIQDRALNIPESGNGISDLLDEIRYELEWLLTIQDKDGGCFHKVTTNNFAPMVMPHQATDQRYMVGKGTAATLNFAASMASAYRAFIDTDEDFAKQCLAASERAWDWAIENPKVPFSNPQDIKTGEYGDTDFEDEWYWAAAELYSSNESPACMGWLLGNPPFIRFQSGDSWNGFMVNLGLIALLEEQPTLPNSQFNSLKQALIQVANEQIRKIENGPYRQPLKAFAWGSNGDMMNAGILLANAYKQTLDKKYLDALHETVDYIFGKNPTGFSFLTGFGSQTPMHIHHRQSEADAVDAPIPGLLVGGPNANKEDLEEEGVDYPTNAPPMKCYVDQVPSYASNEICINWNAPLVYVLGFIEGNYE